MAYTTFYCNEKLLLDNWNYYSESNLMLKNILVKSDYTISECADFYIKNMKNSKSVTYDRNHLMNMFSKKRRNHSGLLCIESVDIYQQDLDYIEFARKRHHISYCQLRVMFGIIFFSRAFRTKYVSLESDFKMKRFGKCYSEKTERVYCPGSTWDNGYNTVKGLYELSDVYKLFNRQTTDDVGCVYEYPVYDLTDESVIT